MILIKLFKKEIIDFMRKESFINQSLKTSISQGGALPHPAYDTSLRDSFDPISLHVFTHLEYFTVGSIHCSICKLGGLLQKQSGE